MLTRLKLSGGQVAWKLAKYDHSMSVTVETNEPATVIADLGVYLTMKHYMSMVSAACFYHLH